MVKLGSHELYFWAGNLIACSYMESILRALQRAFWFNFMKLNSSSRLSHLQKTTETALFIGFYDLKEEKTDE